MTLNTRHWVIGGACSVALIALVLWRILSGAAVEHAERAPAAPPAEAAVAESSEPRVEEAALAAVAMPVAEESEPTAAAEEVAAAPASTTPAEPTIWTRGRAVDRRTGEGVGFAEVVLASGDTEVRGITNADGSFALGDPGFEGAPEASLLDPPGSQGTLLGRFGWEPETHDRAGWKLEVEIGPTYYLDPASLSAPVEELEARLLELPPEDGNENLILVVPGALELAARPASVEPAEWPWTFVRAGPTPWIRYPRQHVEPSSAREAFLTVQSFEAGLRGRARVDSTAGIHRRVVAPSLERCSSARGVVLEKQGRPIAGALVYLTSLENEFGARLAEGPPHWHCTRTGADGSFELFGSRALERHVWVHAAGYEIGYARLDDRAPLRFALDGGSASAARPSGVDCGGWPLSDAPLIVLADSGLRQSYSLAPCALATGERWVSFGVLPLAYYELRPIVCGDGPAVFARSWEYRPPFHAVPYTTRRDAVPFRCEARAAAGDARIESACVLFGPGGSYFGELRADGSPLALSADVPLSWLVFANGFAPVMGTEDALRLRDGVLVADVELKRGSGAMLYLRAGDPSAPDRDAAVAEAVERMGGSSELAGAFAFPPPSGPVEIVAAGPAGRADWRGNALVAVDFQLLSFELRCEGWRIRRLERLIRSAGPPAFPYEYVVWMERQLAY